jgi:hypothetical protein
MLRRGEVAKSKGLCHCPPDRPRRHRIHRPDFRRPSLVLVGDVNVRTVAYHLRMSGASLSKEEYQFLSKIVEDLIESGDEVVALQRYAPSVKDDSKVA